MAERLHIHLSRERRLTMLELACLIFFTTCGGAFGLEPLVGTVGPRLALVLIIVTPFVWTIPMALMVAELATRMPQEGGYYVWVRETLGPFWAVQEAWWTMGYSVALMAIFPVLFVSYLTFLIPELSPSGNTHSNLASLIRWILSILVVFTAMGVNLRGARDVGRSAKIGAYLVLGAFAVLVLTILMRGSERAAFIGVLTLGSFSHHPNTLLLGLSIIVLNYSGWDNVSTYAAEVDKPQRNYPIAIALAMLVVVLAYLVPTLAGLTLTTDPTVWSSDAGWPVIARLSGGRCLGDLLAIAGLVSMWSLFNAQLLYVSRVPYVMAADGWLPKFLAKAPSHTAVPAIAIMGLCVLTAVLTTLSFGELAVIQCVLYAGSLTLEFLALIVVRLRDRTGTRDSFRVPGGLWGLTYTCAAPLIFVAVVLVATLRDWRSYPAQLLLMGSVVISGVALYFFRRRTVSLETVIMQFSDQAE